MKVSRKYRFIIFLFFLFNQILSFGQNQYSYVPLKSTGSIPEEFTFSFSEKYNKKLNSADLQNSKNLELERAFYEESFYHVNQLLNSGKVLFNDPASKYVGKVADIILKDHPEIRERLRFYTVRSSSINAFTSSEGIILVNLGLLCHIKNEAELAFILCHEISHYIEKHPLDIYINNNQIYSQTQSSNFQKFAYQKALVETNKYSKEKEEQADQLGLALYLDSKYSLRSAVEVFDVLKNDNESFGRVELSAADFNSRYINFSDTAFFSSFPEVEPIPLNKTSNTHPNPIRRQTLVRRKVRKMDNSIRSRFLLPEQEFRKLQTKCRFDLVRLYLLENKYERAIYTAKILLEKYPEHPFLVKEIGYALFGLANYANSGRFWDVHIDFQEKNSPENRLNYLFDVLGDEQLNLMAILYNWDLLKKYSSERNTKCLKLLLYRFNNAFFKTNYFEKKKKNPLVKGFKMALEEEEFRRLFESVQKQNPQKEIQPLGINSESGDIEEAKLKGYQFGIDRAIFLDPFFQEYDDRKVTSTQYFKSEKSQKKFLSLINQYAEEFEIDSWILSPSLFDKNDNKGHNQMSLLKLWILEKNNHERIPWVSLYHDEVQAIGNEYQSSYVISLGGIGIKQNRKSKNLTLVAGFLFPPILPYSLFYNFTPQNDFILYAAIYDIRKDASNSLLSKRIRAKANESVMHSQLYDFFLQLQQNRKE